VDRSFSMNGEAMEDIKSILKFFVENMNDSSKFNLIEFGSTINWLFPNSISLKENEKKEEFFEHLKKMKANYGGR
jgi:hypothetical protein